MKYLLIVLLIAVVGCRKAAYQYQTVVIGKGAITERGSNHPMISTLLIRPITITAGTATTNSATIYIASAPNSHLNKYYLHTDSCKRFIPSH